MTPDADPEWIRFPIDEPITLLGLGRNVAARAIELAIRRQGGRLVVLEMTFLTASGSLEEAGAALGADGPSLDAAVGTEPSRQVLAVARFDPNLLASLPSNVAVLRRRLSSSPLSELTNWSPLSVREMA
ncbi:MAG: hypothetical protein RLZZ01_342 [Actinomycetota bacterium]|jgi:hypothetical protein